jgi:TetR/AcrR family transcriptional regulator, transcriptional repressor for nem operon
MGRPRKFVESDVIASASETFSLHGYGGTTLENLVTATGLGKQSLYNAFGGKRELFLRALTAETADAVAAVDEALAQGADTPLERIRAYLLKLAITLSDEQAHGSLFTKATVELADQDTEVAESALQAFGDLKRIYQSCIIDAQDYGEVDPAVDAAAFAGYFLAVTTGMEVLGNAGVSRADLTSIALTSLNALPGVKPERA